MNVGECVQPITWITSLGQVDIMESGENVECYSSDNWCYISLDLKFIGLFITLWQK